MVRNMLRFAAWAALVVIGTTQSLDVETIQNLGNNSLFLKWRPTSRFIAPAGWMNDPCGAMYDPVRDEYHLFYQWHPNHIQWGNISWGHAISKDLITWQDVAHQNIGTQPAWLNANAQALGPTGNGNYNGLGIFSGTAQPVSLSGQHDGSLTIFYTSVSKLPTGWDQPYQPGTETQSFATSKDGGLTWDEYPGNPVIKAPPQGWNITGWRDPFFQPWPEMDEVLGQSEPHYYIVFGSGIKGVGPRMPFYSAPASNLTDWTFLGALWEPKANSSFGGVLETGSWGFNFECSGFFSLKDQDGKVHYYANMGTEGGQVSFHPSAHWALYNEGTVTKRSNGSVAFTPVGGSAADWGLLYALTSFIDVKNNGRRVLWGWAEEDIADGGVVVEQGYQGAFALPRELFAYITKGLSNPDGILEKSGAYVTKASDGTFTASVLGIKPLEDVVKGLRRSSRHSRFTSKTVSSPTILQTNGSSHLELSAKFASPTKQVGLVIAASPDMQEHTTIYYEPSNNTITVDRSSSTILTTLINTNPVIGYFYPYTYANGSTEPIHMRTFLDGSLLEVYVNNRFALTTRIYPSRNDSTGFGVYTTGNSSVVVEDFQAWMETVDVWPGRPRNSSSALVQDSALQTNNYVWWPGN